MVLYAYMPHQFSALPLSSCKVDLIPEARQAKCPSSRLSSHLTHQHGVPCPAGVYIIVWWERARGDGGRKIYLGAVPASSSVLLFYFLILMTSFSATKAILSEPLAEGNHNIKTVLLIVDVKKLTLRIVLRRCKANDLYGL